MTGSYEYIKNSEKPLIMGIVNVTPDSFSDGGKYFEPDEAFMHASALIAEGADIIDIGGESTRPGAESISLAEERRRVIPVIIKIRTHFPDSVISIDTSKSEIAGEAVREGASIINDISGGKFDENMLSTAAEFEVPFVVMHIKGNPKNMQDSPVYDNVIDDINNYFSERINCASAKKVEKLILDPGIGFGKRVEDNYTIISNLEIFKKWDLPLMIGVSRKSFLGKSLGLEVHERSNSTIIAESISVMNGADIVRTHNVKNAVEMKRIYNFLKSGYK